MTLTLRPAAEFSVSELAELFNESFTGYIAGPVHFDRDSLLLTLNRDNTDLVLSRVLMRDEKPSGLLLLARQGWTSRVAAMGVIPEAQNQGVGKWFLTQVIDEARSRGEKAMVLEAFEKNTRAVELYKRLGFTVVRRLVGYDAAHFEGTAEAGLHEIDIYEMGRVVTQHGVSDLPWQVAGTTIARTGAPSRAYQLDHAYGLISNPTAETIILRALIVEPEARRQGQAARLIRALAAHFPNKKWMIPQIWPQEYAEPLLPKLGFTPKALNQVQMHLNLEQK